MNIVLVTGGARAGKSAWAEQEAGRLGGDDVTYVATAEARDDEMARRISAHRAARSTVWRTVEAPVDVSAVIRGATTNTVLLDCLTLWVSNLLLIGRTENAEHAASEAERRVHERVDGLLATAADRAGTLIVVTNEVGLGLVPDNALARAYRDLLGWTNARIAREADRVVLMIAGIPVFVRS